MKSTLLLIIGILPLSLLSIVNFATIFAEATLPPIAAVPTEMQNLSDSTAAAKQKAEAAHPYLKDVDNVLAKKNDISPNSATDLDEITIDGGQYAKLRKALKGIWDVRQREKDTARLSKTILDTLIKQYKALAYDGLNSENGKKYREYVADRITGLQDLLVKRIEYELEETKWIAAEAEFNAGKFESAQRMLEGLDMQIIVGFIKIKPPIVTTSGMADMITACEYNVALEKIEDEQLSLRNILNTLTSSDVEELLSSIQRFENKYPVVPVKAKQEPYEQLQKDKDAFTLFNELLVREISDDPMSWGVELQKLMNDITKLREFGVEFSRPIVEKQKEKLDGILISLAKESVKLTPLQLKQFELELEQFRCVYYLAGAGGRILFSKTFSKNKTGFLLDTTQPPKWFFKPPVLRIIPLRIFFAEIDCKKLPCDPPGPPPLLAFFKRYREQIVKLEDKPSEMNLWSELLTYIGEQRAWLVDYNNMGGGYPPEVDDSLDSLESVAEKIVKALPEIERFLQQ